jgi:hypothetical protein
MKEYRGVEVVLHTFLSSALVRIVRFMPQPLYCRGNSIYQPSNSRQGGSLHAARMVGGGEVHTGLWLGELRERDHLEDLGVDRTIVLKWIFKQWDGGVDWIDMAQDKDRWRGVVNAAVNLRVPQNAGNFLPSWGPVSFPRRTLLHGVSKSVSQSVSQGWPQNGSDRCKEDKTPLHLQRIESSVNQPAVRSVLYRRYTGPLKY